MSDELWRLSACEAAQGVRDKRFSAEELMTSVTQRIAEHNPRLNAIVLDLGEEAPAVRAHLLDLGDRVALLLWRSF